MAQITVQKLHVFVEELVEDSPSNAKVIVDHLMLGPLKLLRGMIDDDDDDDEDDDDDDEEDDDDDDEEDKELARQILTSQSGRIH